MSSWRFFCIWNQTTPLALSQENIKKVSKHIDGFFAKNIEHISKHVDWFFAKNIEHNAKHVWMDLLPDLRIARSTTPAGGRQGQERSRKNRGGNNNQHSRKVFMIHLFWKDKFEDDKRIPKNTTAIDMCRVYQWEERLGIEREQSLSKSSPDLSRFVELDVVTISFCMLDWSAMIPQFILYVQFINRW